MPDDEIKYWVALDYVDGLSLKRTERLEKALGSAQRVWNASPAALLKAGAEERFANAIPQLRQQASADQLFQRVHNARMRAVHLPSPAYPELLRKIHDPPRVLYYTGDLNYDGRRAVGVVGTRLPSTYGKRMAQKLAYALGELGITVVSGLARGVDKIAHNAVLDANGKTIGVLGGALDKIYPQDAAPLARRIAQNGGAVISEYPPGTKAQRHHFPLRNRIISGMCAGILVIEGRPTSGALITARSALDQNRDVFALPGEADAVRSSGPNELIQNGAKLVMSVDDILDEMNLLKLITDRREAARSAPSRNQGPSALKDDLSSLEQRILSALEDGDKHIDELVHAVEAEIGDLTADLMKLELRGNVERVGSMRFALAG